MHFKKAAEATPTPKFSLINFLEKNVSNKSVRPEHVRKFIVTIIFEEIKKIKDKNCKDFACPS